MLSFLNGVKTQITHTHRSVTRSYSEHKVLGTFYEEWDDLADDFIETYQGKYGRMTGPVEADAVDDLDVVSYLTTARLFLSNDMSNFVGREDTDMLNIIADMISLVNHTLYLLTLN